MSKIVKVVAILLLIGGSIAAAPGRCFGAAPPWRRRPLAVAAWRRLGRGGGFGGGWGLGGWGWPRPYYGGYYYRPGPYYYDDHYASNCGWVRVRVAQRHSVAASGAAGDASHVKQ